MAYLRHTTRVRILMQYIRDIRVLLHKAGQRDEYPKSGSVPPKSGRLTPMGEHDVRM